MAEEESMASTTIENEKEKDPGQKSRWLCCCTGDLGRSKSSTLNIFVFSGSTEEGENTEELPGAEEETSFMTGGQVTTL